MSGPRTLLGVLAAAAAAAKVQADRQAAAAAAAAAAGVNLPPPADVSRETMPPAAPGPGGKPETAR